MRTWSIGICTPIPAVPVDREGFDRVKAAEALDRLEAKEIRRLDEEDLRSARRLLRDAVRGPLENDPAAARQTHLGLITPEWQRARQMLQVPMGHAAVDVYADGMEIGQARCRAVEAAREANLRFLFFLDWDVIVPQDTLLKLVWHLENNPDHDVASGVYCQKNGPAPPLLWHEWNNGVYYDWTAGDVLKEGQVMGVPMGCCLLRLSLFDKLPHSAEDPWFKTVDQPVKLDTGLWQRAKMTEDLWFCKRYGEGGGKILVDTSILCHHICHYTGTRYKLAADSLPMRRAKERAAADKG